MRLLLPALAMACALLPFGLQSAHADDYYPGGYGVSYHASTYEEGVQRGFADVVRSAGDYNLRNSQAAINYEQARSDNLDNRLKYTQTYFEMRQLNKQYRAAEAGPKPTSEQLFQIAKDRAPSRMSTSELDPLTGDIAWPVLLRDAPYDPYRTQLEALFQQRANRGSTGSANYQQIKQTAAAMEAELKSRLQQYPSGDYIQAKKFIEGLAYESGFSS